MDSNPIICFALIYWRTRKTAMPLRRRTFMQFTSTGALASAFAPPLRAAPANAVPADTHTDSDGIEHWFLGNGRLVAALQTVRKPDSAATHCGLILLSANHIVQKHASFFFSEARGFWRSRTYS